MLSLPASAMVPELADTGLPSSIWLKVASIAMATVSLPVDRIITGATQKRLNQHAVEALITALTELLNADSHTLVPISGLGDVGTEQTVPPRQVEAEV